MLWGPKLLSVADHHPMLSPVPSPLSFRFTWLTSVCLASLPLVVISSWKPFLTPCWGWWPSCTPNWDSLPAVLSLRCGLMVSSLSWTSWRQAFVCTRGQVSTCDMTSPVNHLDPLSPLAHIQTTTEAGSFWNLFPNQTLCSDYPSQPPPPPDTCGLSCHHLSPGLQTTTIHMNPLWSAFTSEGVILFQNGILNSLPALVKHFQRLSGTSLVVQWLRIRLPMQGIRVRFLPQEESTCLGAISLWATTSESAP